MKRKLLLILSILFLIIVSGVVLAQEAQHQHPDELEEEGNPAVLQQWFADRLGTLYSDCASGLTEWNTEVCEPINTEGASFVERYRTVELRTTPAVERRAEEFATARRQESKLASSVATFAAVYEEYEAAQTAGNDQKMREHAIELRRLAGNIDETSTELNKRLRALDNATSADFDTAASEVLTTSNNITALAREGELTAFDETNLEVTSDTEASFAEPANVSGTLETSGGEPVSGAEITVIDEVGHRINATTDATGEFVVLYRPVATEIGQTTVTVRYDPDLEEPYSGSEQTVTVNVSKTPASVSITEATTEAAFEDEVTVEGRVSAADDYPSNVSVRVIAEGTEIANGRTDGEGRLDITGTVPANVPSGTVNLSVMVSQPGRALSTARGTRTMMVPETNMTLFARSEELDTGEVRISGELSTRTQLQPTPVADQSVNVTIGEESWTATTDEEGTFELTIDNLADYEEVVVSYEDPSTNLANITVIIPNPGDSSLITGLIKKTFNAGIGIIEYILSLDRSTLFGGIVVVIAVISAIIFTWRHPRTPSPDVGVIMSTFSNVLSALRRLLPFSIDAAAANENKDTNVIEPETVSISDFGESDLPEEELSDYNDVDETILLDAARKGINDSPTRAVQMSYAAVRHKLSVADTMTHWEAYRNLRSTLPDTQRDAFQRLTETFEQATFTNKMIDRETAAEAVADAEHCISDAEV